MRFQGYRVEGEKTITDHEEYAEAMTLAFREQHGLSLNGVLVRVPEHEHGVHPDIWATEPWHILYPDELYCVVTNM